MPVTVNINSAQIAVDIRAASEKALGITSQQALADCNEYVPDDQDALVNSSNIHSDILHGKLVWSTPYARYLYPENRFSMGAGGSDECQGLAGGAA